MESELHVHFSNGAPSFGHGHRGSRNGFRIVWWTLGDALSVSLRLLLGCLVHDDAAPRLDPTPQPSLAPSDRFSSISGRYSRVDSSESCCRPGCPERDVGRSQGPQALS